MRLDRRIWDFIRERDFYGATVHECATHLKQSPERIAVRIRALLKAHLLARSTVRRAHTDLAKNLVYFANFSDPSDFDRYAGKTRLGRNMKEGLSLTDNEILTAGRAFLNDWRHAAVVARTQRKKASEKAVLRLVRSLQKIAREQHH